ncbi:uncharacterized protein LOC127256777 [Andrographis paniculata]|uniref:uncharacterized protein LOC127256777 n=1 Tax=Andrographis paniculata TaxID=175694 RepID=UPI0021E8F550|nr:uncharacterized protein LOC127256777 [Andrographis paniculata]
MKFTRMGFLLIFFPEEHHHHQQHQQQSIPPKKSPNFTNTFQSSSNLLLGKAQSTISICLLLLFLTVLLFTLTTLPNTAPSAAGAASRRRLLLHHHQTVQTSSNLSHALQKMGALYRRGNKAMNDVVVAHVPEAVTSHVLKLFLRLFFRSSLAARSDLVLVFPARRLDFDDVVLHESDLFLKLLDRYAEEFNNTGAAAFDVGNFMKLNRKEKEIQEPIWGRRSFNYSGEPVDSNRPSYGSVVGFDVDELDPENSLSGFLDPVPMSLRRWAVYPMLLGRVKRNFKHILLIDVKEILLTGDPLGRFRSLSPESVLLKHISQPVSGKHGRRGPARPRQVHAGIVIGGAKGVRRLANEMLTVIVRAAMGQRKKKNPVTEAAVFNQLVGNGYFLKNVELVPASESALPELSQLGVGQLGVKSGLGNYSVVRRAEGGVQLCQCQLSPWMAHSQITAADLTFS